MYAQLKSPKTTLLTNFCTQLSLYNNLTLYLDNLLQNMVKFVQMFRF